MSDRYGTTITNIGLAKLANAQITQSKVELTHIALGDANGGEYVPTPEQISLVNEVWRGSVTEVTIDSKNDNRIIADILIPAAVGGFTIREIGLFDIDGDLIAISRYPETYKPSLEQGIANDSLIHMTIETANADVVSLKVDPSVIMASREYVDKKITEHSNETTQAHGAHDPQDILFSRDSNGRISSVSVKKPDEFGVSRIMSTMNYDESGRLISVNEKVFDANESLQSEATATMIYENNQLEKVEVR